jgi:hypothetical protein
MNAHSKFASASTETRKKRRKATIGVSYVQQTLPFKFDGNENELNNKESAASGEVEEDPEEEEETNTKKKKKKKTTSNNKMHDELQRHLRAHRRRASKNLTDKEVMANSELILVGIHHGRKGRSFLYHAKKECVYVVGSAPEGGKTYEMKCIIAKFIADTPGFEFLKTPCKMQASDGVLVWSTKGLNHGSGHYTWNQRFKEAVLSLLSKQEIEELTQCTLIEYVDAVNNIEEGGYKNVSRPAYFDKLVPEHTSQDKAIVMLTNLRFLVPDVVNKLLRDKRAKAAEMTSEIPGVTFRRCGSKVYWQAHFTPVPGGKSVRVKKAHLGPNKSPSNKEHLTEFMIGQHAKRFNKEKVVFVELYKNEENNQLAARVHTCVEAKKGEPVPDGKFSVLTLMKALRPHHKELGAAVDKFHGVPAAASGMKKHFAPKRKRVDDGSSNSAQDAQKKAKTA